MNTIFERRKYIRFLLEFETEVVSRDSEGKEFEEKVTLENISGEGAQFLTREGSRYFPGQSLTMKIHLPGTDEIKASMQGRTTVVRITQGVNSDENKMNQPAYIAIKFDTPLQFERNDPSA